MSVTVMGTSLVPKASGLLLILVRCLISAFSQEEYNIRPSFEVATIKPSRSNEGFGSPYEVNGDRFTATGLTLKSLIAYAYRVKDVQGGPGWVRSQLWVVNAKAREKILTRKLTFAMRDDTPDMASMMLQSLLEERFKLKLQRQKKDYPVYNVVVAKGGPKVQPSADQSPPSPVLPPSGRMGELQRGGARKSLDSFEGRAIPIDTFVNLLEGNSDRPLINRTNLAGLYDIRIKWSREEFPADTISGTASPFPGTALFFGPGFFAAIQEQLGLKLEPGKAPFDIIVISSVQKPSEN